MSGTPESKAAALDESVPIEDAPDDTLHLVEGPEPDPAEVDRIRRLVDIAVAAAFVLKVAWFLVASRGWFYTGDDWDYLTRTGFREVFEPHNGHLTALASGYAMAIRNVFGYDYWPGYAILPALSLPLVGAAAYYVWRRHRINPVVAGKMA